MRFLRYARGQTDVLITILHAHPGGEVTINNSLADLLQTPLCLAVIANSPSLVRRLISVGSDVNFELQRSQLNNLGIVCYRLIHCVAKKGLEWSHTLDALLDAPAIDLNVANSEGCQWLIVYLQLKLPAIYQCFFDLSRVLLDSL